MKLNGRIAIAMIGIASAVVSAQAGGDKVAFPEDYAKGVLYTTVDRADNKQFRELFTSAAAVERTSIVLSAIPAVT